MNPAPTKLRARIFDWLVAGLISAFLSLLGSYILITQLAFPDRFAFLISLALLSASTVYLGWLWIRSDRILRRLGIVDVITRQGNRNCDRPSNADSDFRFLGMSAVNILTDERVEATIELKHPKRIDVVHLDSTCDAAVRNLAESAPQHRTHVDIKRNINTMLLAKERLEQHKGPPDVTTVPHPLSPAFRIVNIDEKLMYVGEYTDENYGFSSDLIVLKNLKGQPSLFSMFENYYERTRAFALKHLVSRALIRIVINNPTLRFDTLERQVLAELDDTAAAGAATSQLLRDIIKEYGLDDSIVSEDV